GRELEAVLAGPIADRRSGTLEDGDIEGVDAFLLDDGGRGGDGRAVSGPELGGRRRVRLAVEPLQRPVAAPLDVRRDSRQRDDRAELGAPALEAERGDVVLESRVVGRQRAG